MARRKDHTPEELRSLVISHVLSFLQTQPASQLSLRKVAGMVGYSAGTLINLFGSYAYLLLEVNAHTLDEISDLMTEASEQHASDPAQQITVLAEQYLEFARQHPYQWQILFDHHLPEEDPVPDWQLQRINRVFTLIEQILSSLNPTATQHECHKAGRVIWTAVHGICLLEIDDKLFAQDSVTGDSMIRSLLTHYLGAWKHSSEGGL